MDEVNSVAVINRSAPTDGARKPRMVCWDEWWEKNAKDDSSEHKAVNLALHFDTASAREPTIQSARLTGRQVDVAMLVSNGYSNKKIARQLGITEVTVKIHLSALYKCLCVSSRAQAIIRLLRDTRICMEGN